MPRYNISKEELEDFYLNQRKSVIEMSGILGMSIPGIYKAMERYGIPRRDLAAAAHVRRRGTYDTDWGPLCEKYEQGISLEEIALEVGCSISTASQHLKRAGATIRPRGTETVNRPNFRGKINIDIDKAVELNRNGSTLSDIGRLLGGIAVQVISKRMKEAGQPVIKNKVSKDEFKSYPTQKRIVARAINATACAICGETRAVDLCHILPRHRGGELIPENTIPLCQTHHHCFDRGTLKGPELSKIRTRLKAAEEDGYKHPHY
jgi:AraC-like DNA-binding protein